MTRLSARLLALTLAAGLLLVPAVAQAKPATPKATAPAVNATVSTMPSLTWNKAKGATSYEVQIASDSGFNPALVDVTTPNLRFVHSTMLPNGAYFWRVRSLDATGGSSKWSKVRKFTKKWTAATALATPATLSAIAYPLADDPDLGAGARRVDVPGLGRERRLGRRRRRARRDHLERRARVERRRQADRRRPTRTSPSRPRCTRARTTGRSSRSTPRVTTARRRRSSRSPGSGPGRRRRR